VQFSCWSELNSLDLAETNLKSLNHDYHMLTGCNKLTYLSLMDNNLGILCFEHFPDLPTLIYLNIRNNSLINLDVVGLKEKFPALLNIIATRNKWSCEFNRTISKENLIKMWDKDEICLNNSVNPEAMKCSTVHKEENNVHSSVFVSFWIIMIMNCVLFIIVLALLKHYKL
jgi:hypothetical protein